MELKDALALISVCDEAIAIMTDFADKLITLADSNEISRELLFNKALSTLAELRDTVGLSNL